MGSAKKFNSQASGWRLLTVDWHVKPASAVLT